MRAAAFCESKNGGKSMATLKLNIYGKEDKAKIEKTYTAEGYDLMLGTVEDFMDIIDIDKMSNDREVALMVVKCYKKLKPLLLDIFPGISDEELQRVKVSELIPLFVDVAKSVVDSLGVLKTGKN